MLSRIENISTLPLASKPSYEISALFCQPVVLLPYDCLSSLFPFDVELYSPMIAGTALNSKTFRLSVSVHYLMHKYKWVYMKFHYMHHKSGEEHANLRLKNVSFFRMTHCIVSGTKRLNHINRGIAFFIRRWNNVMLNCALKNSVDRSLRENVGR